MKWDTCMYRIRCYQAYRSIESIAELSAACMERGWHSFRAAFFFFLNDPAPTEFYTLPLPAALPISARLRARQGRQQRVAFRGVQVAAGGVATQGPARGPVLLPGRQAQRQLEQDRERVEVQRPGRRSEEHTSELQSPCNLVCRLLLEK